MNTQKTFTPAEFAEFIARDGWVRTTRTENTLDRDEETGQPNDSQYCQVFCDYTLDGVTIGYCEQFEYSYSTGKTYEAVDSWEADMFWTLDGAVILGEADEDGDAEEIWFPSAACRKDFDVCKFMKIPQDAIVFAEIPEEDEDDEESSWTTIARAVEQGSVYGHQPGRPYHDVAVSIEQRGQNFRVEIIETWGSCQGYDQEHGRNRVVAIDSDLDDAVAVACERAETAEIDANRMIQALSATQADACDTLAHEDDEESSWTTIARAVEDGTAYGHQPGHPYHDVAVSIERRGENFRVEIIETWGSCQGYDQEHGRKCAVAIDSDMDDAVDAARERAEIAEIDAKRMTQALSAAQADSLDALADA